MNVPKQKEDFTTELLAELIKSDVAVLHLFLKFLFADGVQAENLARLPLQVSTQHVIPNGRLDLLIHHRSMAVIIECKVNDAQRVYQLQKYYNYWFDTHQTKPNIFWLARRNITSLGLNPYLTAEWSWDELCSYLQSRCDILNSKARLNIEKFCQYLQNAEILLHPGEGSIRQIRDRGYRYEYSEQLLAEVASHFEDSVFEVTPPMNKVTHRLFIGRRKWVSKFEDGWLQRAVLQFKPDVLRNGFFWHGNIMLYNRHNIPDPSFAITKLPQWAPICKKAGFRLLRNRGANWNGKYSYEIEAPYLVTKPVKYFHAPLPDQTWPVKTFEQGDEKEALAEGVQIVQYLYQTVDSF